MKIDEVTVSESAEAMADPDAFMASACDVFTRAGVRQLYISHDIDATDPRWAAATGTRELNGLTPQVILRWHIQVGTLVIPKSSNPDRLKENFEIFDFNLDEQEMNEIAGLDVGMRTGLHPDKFG